MLVDVYNATPGLTLDRIKAVLESAWAALSQSTCKGLIFAYDEAQNLADHASDKEYPLSVLLDAFQSIQRKGIPFMLVLTGLPTLFPKLVEARTYSERMFRVLQLQKLDEKESVEAIEKPIRDSKCPVKFSPGLVQEIVKQSGGYPYFIQFICREVYDTVLQRPEDKKLDPISMEAIVRKLDSDFFAGRWTRATDRQRELLMLIADLPNCDREFTVQEIVELSERKKIKPFRNSNVNQMLGSLTDSGLIYKNRYGKYSFAIPLFGDFIRRQFANTDSLVK